MKFGIITPVFDGCLGSLELLSGELRLQTHSDWVWMLCSNGRSDKLADFALRQREQAIYLHTEREDETDAFALLENIGKRRDFCLKTIDADYIFMIDADAKILRTDMFQRINSRLEKDPRSMCIYKIIHEVGVLPIFPIWYGRIDMLNFCVKANLAKKVGYPRTVKPDVAGNDFWYFTRVSETSGYDYAFIDEIFCEHNGNNRYEHLMHLLSRDRAAREGKSTKSSMGS